MQSVAGLQVGLGSTFQSLASYTHRVRTYAFKAIKMTINFCYINTIRFDDCNTLLCRFAPEEVSELITPSRLEYSMVDHYILTIVSRFVFGNYGS